MTSDFIFGAAAMIGALLLIALWPTGRVIVLETLLHPLRPSVIVREPDGSVVAHPFADTEWHEQDPGNPEKHQLGIAPTRETSRHPIS